MSLAFRTTLIEGSLSGGSIDLFGRLKANFTHSKEAGVAGLLLTVEREACNQTLFEMR